MQQQGKATKNLLSYYSFSLFKPCLSMPQQSNQKNLWTGIIRKAHPYRTSSRDLSPPHPKKIQQMSSTCHQRVVLDIHDVFHKYAPVFDWLLDPEYPSLDQINLELLPLAFQHIGLEAKGSAGVQVHSAYIPVQISTEYSCLINFGSGVAHMEPELKNLLKSRKGAMKFFPDHESNMFAEYIEVAHFHNGLCMVTFVYSDEYNLQTLQVWKFQRKPTLTTTTNGRNKNNLSMTPFLGELDLHNPIISYFDEEIPPCYFCIHYKNNCNCTEVMRSRWKRKLIDAQRKTYFCFQNFYEFIQLKDTRDVKSFRVEPESQSLILHGTVKVQRKIEKINAWDVIISKFLCPIYNLAPNVRSEERDNYFLSNFKLVVQVLKPLELTDTYGDSTQDTLLNHEGNGDVGLCIPWIAGEVTIPHPPLDQSPTVAPNNVYDLLNGYASQTTEPLESLQPPKSTPKQNKQDLSDNSTDEQQTEIEKFFQCNICQAAFTRSTNLKRHYRRAHNGEEDVSSGTYVCEHCGVSFNQKNSLQYHIVKTHSEETGFQCVRCNKSYKTKSNLNKHLLTVHQKITNYDCHLCDMKFYQKFNLNRHLDTVHRNIRDNPEEGFNKEMQEEDLIKVIRESFPQQTGSVRQNDY